jgi:phenylalanyl-tRNA synthetase beta chain
MNQKNKVINFQVEKFEKLIGISITANEIDKILSSLGFKCKKSQKTIKVEVPSWRPDVSLDEDLIEELIRIKGFNNIKLIEPSKNRTQDT